MAAEELPATRGWSPWDRFIPLSQSKLDSSMLTPPWWRTNQEPRLGSQIAETVLGQGLTICSAQGDESFLQGPRR